MSDRTAASVKNRPMFWRPEGAMTLPETIILINKHRHSSLPLSTAMFAIIFFEESTCCNTLQTPPFAIGPGQLQVSDPGPRLFFAGENADGDFKDNAMGGRWDSSMTVWLWDAENKKRIHRHQRLRPDLPELKQTEILSNKDFGVKMHLKMMEWEWRGYTTGEPKDTFSKLLGAQIGGQSKAMRQKARAAFAHGANQLQPLISKKPKLEFLDDGSLSQEFYHSRRREFAKVLNHARRQIHSNQIPYLEYFYPFWEYFLPDGFMADPPGFMRCGF